MDGRSAVIEAHPLPEPDPPLSDGVVTLRTFGPDDADQIFAACQDPIIQRYIPVPRPYRH